MHPKKMMTSWLVVVFFSFVFVRPKKTTMNQLVIILFFFCFYAPKEDDD
jgi:hypothetical protein